MKLPNMQKIQPDGMVVISCTCLLINLGGSPVCPPILEILNATRVL